MKRAACVSLLIASVLGPVAYAGSKPARTAAGPRLEAVTLLIRHRIFHDFADVQQVKLNQEFRLGDSDYSARMVQYVPDFEMDLQSRRVFSRGDQPNNPAFRIIVRKSRVPQDTSWAFLNMPPHFGRRAYFAFQVLRIDFAGHAPMLADTAAARPSAPSPGRGSPGRADSTSRDSAGRP